MAVKNAIAKVKKAAGKIENKLSSLNAAQVEEVQAKREMYLLEKPKLNDEVALEITMKMLAANSIEIFNSYLPQIKELYLPIQKNVEYGEDTPFDVAHNIRYINITKWVTDAKENSIEKLINVYSVLSNEDCNIALIFNRTRTNTNVYFAVVNTKNDDNSVDAESYKRRLVDAIKGNFPGSELGDINGGRIPCIDGVDNYSVAIASNIPTEKSERFASQTIEKLLDGIVPDSKRKEYTIVLLATPISDIEERKNKISDFYSGMVPYASWQTNFTVSENEMRGATATVGVNIGASAGIQNSQSQAVQDSISDQASESVTESDIYQQALSNSRSEAESEMAGYSEGWNATRTQQSGVQDTLGVNYSDNHTVTNTYSTGGSSSRTSGKNNGFSGGLSFVLSAQGNTGSNKSRTRTSTWNASEAEAEGWSRGVNAARSISSSVAESVGLNSSRTLSRGMTNTLSETVSETTGTQVANMVGKAVTKGMATTNGISKALNHGINAGANFARSTTVTAMIGKNEGITQNFANYNVKHALELLENQMKRLEQSSALGMWDFAAYVLSEDSDTASNVAHTYLALTLGEESYMSKSAVNVWKGNVQAEAMIASSVIDYIKELRHPRFAMNSDYLDYDRAFNVYPSIVTATTALSGKELAYSLNFPKKSISGLPIFECAEFGRNVTTYDSIYSESSRIEIGKIFHMNHEEKNTVDLCLDSLTSHAFITGSTGSGKSNTIYQLINKARNQNTKFLIIEPAKGEYKNVFGNDSDVTVLGTNPKISKLLRLNPFSFNRDIHILEHLDRLVEIFNVCWPMYAAMPAVLKQAIEMSYIDCGWDLECSENKYDELLYPTFADVARNVKKTIDSSEYDSENKGAYKGSLLTRLQSLTNGINGMIFVTNEITNEDLFDSNVVIDLSRVGSSETKSLIMGMLIIKLQEYRMSSGLMNSSLNHLTVLEEAHNILRRTSIQQSSESSNLLGKSVEMLSNAIAEMRTYGEGFIIADQAPGLMDMSVIRNTNTKIIMRLPDQSDRELVGKAANLSDLQIKELSKLPCGVAAIYQNEWIQPVLCKIDKYDSPYGSYTNRPEDSTSLYGDREEIKESLIDCIMNSELQGGSDLKQLENLKKLVVKSRLDSVIKRDLLEYVTQDNSLENLRVLIYDLVSAEKAIQDSVDAENIKEWMHLVVDKLNPTIKSFSKQQIDMAMSLIIYEHSLRDASYNNLLCRFEEIYSAEGGVY